MKECKICKEEKELTEFYKKENSIDGYQHQCKKCNNKITNSNRNKRNLEVRNFIIKQKEENPCSDCGDYFPYYVMDYDHLPKYNKEFEISQGLSLGKTEEDIKKEINKCELVCANCHRIRTYIRSIDR